MKKRGRKSAAELAVAPVVQIVPRSPAPPTLCDEEAAEWEKYVSTMEASYFRDADHATLENLCRHTVAARRISTWIDKVIDAGDGDLVELDRLYRMRERETRAATAMARTLRLTKQAQYGPRKAAGQLAGGEGKPWEAS